jgi:hypothetical protein
VSECHIACDDLIWIESTEWNFETDRGRLVSDNFMQSYVITSPGLWWQNWIENLFVLLTQFIFFSLSASTSQSVSEIFPHIQIYRYNFFLNCILERQLLIHAVLTVHFRISHSTTHICKHRLISVDAKEDCYFFFFSFWINLLFRIYIACTVQLWIIEKMHIL